MRTNLIKKLSFIYYRLHSFFRVCADKLKKISKEPIFKARVGAVFAAFVLTVSIFAWGTIDNGFAWFAANKRVEATGMQITVEEMPSVTATLKSHGILAIDGNDYTVEINAEKYDLPLHDPNGISSDKYKLALLIEIEMWSDKEIAVDLVASTENSEYIWDLNNFKSNFISNCLMISSATFNSDTDIAVKGNESFVFTSVVGDGEDIKCNKVSELRLDSFTLTTEKQKVYFLFEYNEAFLDYINNEILKSGEMDALVQYSNDLIFTIRKQV